MRTLRRKREIKWLSSGLLLGVAMASRYFSSAHALEASDILVLSRGPLSLRPQAELVGQFNDNIYYAPSGSAQRQSDLITILAPGLRVLVGEDTPNANHFSLRYRLENVVFMDHEDQNALQHKITDDMSFTWTRLSVSGQDRFEWLSSILGAGFGGVPSKVDRFVWSDYYSARYNIGERTGVYGSVAHYSTDYAGTYANLYETRNNTGTVGLDYRISSETHFFGEVYYGNTTRERNISGLAKLPGLTSIGGFVGARGKFTEKLRGLVKAGYATSAFEGTAGPGQETSAGTSPVVEVGVSYQFTERLSLSLNYTRRQQVSVQYTSGFYIDDSVGLRANQIIGATGRLRADAGINYTLASYERAAVWPGGRSDTFWNFDAGISYQFQTWLSSRLGYSYDIFSSSFNGIVDYDVNRVTLSLSVGY